MLFIVNNHGTKEIWMVTIKPTIIAVLMLVGSAAAGMLGPTHGGIAVSIFGSTIVMLLGFIAMSLQELKKR